MLALLLTAMSQAPSWLLVKQIAPGASGSLRLECVYSTQGKNWAQLPKRAPADSAEMERGEGISLQQQAGNSRHGLANDLLEALPQSPRRLF